MEPPSDGLLGLVAVKKLARTVRKVSQSFCGKQIGLPAHSKMAIARAGRNNGRAMTTHNDDLIR